MEKETNQRCYEKGSDEMKKEGNIGKSVGDDKRAKSYIFLYFVLPLGCTVCATYILIPGPLRPEPGDRWFGNLLVSSVNWLLPVAQIGGWIARVHWLSKRRVPISIAGASAFVDITLQAFAQSMVGILGLILLIYFFWQEKVLIFSGLLVAVLLLLSVYILYKIQNKGVFFYLTKFCKKHFVWAGTGPVRGKFSGD